MKKIFAICAAVVMLLCGCSFGGPEPTITAPSRMVIRADIAFSPSNPDFERAYTNQDTLDQLLQLLRSIQTVEYPEVTPDLAGGQSYYTITITYANGRVGEYHLLGHSWLQMGGVWCRVSNQDALKFNEFIKDNPSE